jgi:hypothetical protein
LAKHYPHEASYEKMKAAQTGGSLELGPTGAEQRQIQQQLRFKGKRGQQGKLLLLRLSNSKPRHNLRQHRAGQLE